MCYPECVSPSVGILFLIVLHYESSVHLSDFPLALMFITTHFCLLTEYAGGWRFIAQKELSEVMNENPMCWLMVITQLRQENC